MLVSSASRKFHRRRTRTLGALIPYGPNTYYDGSTGEYISATGQRYKSPQEMNAADMAANFSPTYDYNHTQWASDATAQQVAQNTGGTVVRSEVYGGAMPTWNLIDYGGQDKFNAGLVAQLYATYPKWQADAMLAAEAATGGAKSFTSWQGPTIDQVKAAEAASQPAATITTVAPAPEPAPAPAPTPAPAPAPAPAAPSTGSQTSTTKPPSYSDVTVDDDGRIVVRTPVTEAITLPSGLTQIYEQAKQLPLWVWVVVAAGGAYLLARKS